VGPASIPDYLALVGDSADGFPGLPGWGAKSAAAVLAVYGHVEDVPAEPGRWDVPVRGARELSRVLEANRDLVALFKDLATLRTDGIEWKGSEALHWRGPTPAFADVARRLRAPDLLAKAETLSSAAGGG
jgi:5'-3' exonuclease